MIQDSDFIVVGNTYRDAVGCWDGGVGRFGWSAIVHGFLVVV